MSSAVVDQAVIDGFEMGISAALGLVPIAGGFLSIIFSQLWGLAFFNRTFQQRQEALESLYAAVSKMIGQALDQLVRDQANALNSTIAQMGQEYVISVTSYKENPGSDTRNVALRFESCKNTLTQMLNLFSQPSYMKLVLLSYGTSLSMYVGLLKEMIHSGEECGYSPSEIAAFQTAINDRLDGAFQVLYDATCKLVLDSGEFYYPKVGETIMQLQKLVAGVMNFNTNWHTRPCILAKEHEDFFGADGVDDKAQYQLNFRRPTGSSKPYYHMPQVLMASRPALHVYKDVSTDLEVAVFVSSITMDVRLRACYLIDYQDYDSSDVVVTIRSSDIPQVASFNLRNRYQSIVSKPWVKMYYTNFDGGPWSTHFDKFSKEMRMHYDEYGVFTMQARKRHFISTKGGSSAVRNYYIIGFEIVPQIK